MSETDEPEARNLDYESISSALDALLRLLPEEPTASGALRPFQLRRLRERIAEVVEKLSALRAQLDTIRMPATVLDPSDPQVIGRLIADTLLVQARHPLAVVPRFYGSGVYALYYTGDFPAYRPIRNSDTPIYVGKADPAMHGATTPQQQGERLARRLGEHAKSIRAAENLELDDFECRYLVVTSAWQNTAETYLIQRFRPVWNNEVGICYGFGKHGDDPGTRGNQRSPWDTIHPGRPWAMKEGNRPNELSPEGILARVAAHFEENPPQM
jgi:hypothetical protein